MARQKTGSHITGQGKSFIDAARSFGCDESEERFGAGATPRVPSGGPIVAAEPPMWVKS